MRLIGHPNLRGLLWPDLTCGEEHEVETLKPQDDGNLASMVNLGWFDYKRDYLILKRSTSPILVSDIDLVVCERDARSCMFFQIQFDTEAEQTKRQFCFTREKDHCAGQGKEPEVRVYIWLTWLSLLLFRSLVEKFRNLVKTSPKIQIKTLPKYISQTRESGQVLFIRFVPSNGALPTVEANTRLKPWLTRRRVWPEAINEREKCFEYGTCSGFTDHTKHYLMAIGVIGTIISVFAVGLISSTFRFSCTVVPLSPKSKVSS